MASIVSMTIGDARPLLEPVEFGLDLLHSLRAEHPRTIADFSSLQSRRSEHRQHKQRQHAHPSMLQHGNRVLTNGRFLNLGLV